MLGFFYGEANRLNGWADTLLSSLEILPDSSIIQEVGGIFSYYCYVLAEFDPVRYRQIYDGSTMEDVIRALSAKHLYNKPRDRK